MISWVLDEGEHWSGVWSGTLSPAISGLLSVDGGVSSSLSSVMSVLDGGLEVVVVESVSIWDGSSLRKSVHWVWLSSPGVGFFLLLVAPENSSVVFILSILKGALKLSESISVVISRGWVSSSSLVEGEHWSGVWSGTLSPAISGLLSVDGGVSSSLGSVMGVLDGGLEVVVVEGVAVWNSSSLIK